MKKLEQSYQNSGYVYRPFDNLGIVEEVLPYEDLKQLKENYGIYLEYTGFYSVQQYKEYCELLSKVSDLLNVQLFEEAKQLIDICKEMKENFPSVILQKEGE